MAKGKIEDDGFTVDNIVNDNTNISKIVAEQVKKAVEPFVKQNEEMKVALANRSQIQSHSGGSQESSGGEVKKEFWSAEQLADFKKLKIDPNKVYENWQKKINK